MTVEDVLALTLFSVTDRLGAFAVVVLEVHTDEIAGLLREIPVDLAMHHAPRALYTPGSALTEVRAEAGGIEDLSLLHCLDVVLWMRLKQPRW